MISSSFIHLEMLLGSRLSAMIRDNRWELSLKYSISPLIGEHSRENKDLTLLLHVLSFSTAVSTSHLFSKYIAHQGLNTIGRESHVGGAI